MKTIVSLAIAVLAAPLTAAADIFARSLASEFPSESFGNDSAAAQFSAVSPRGVDQGLFQRQSERCVDAGYIPCSNVPGKCCPAGYDCFADAGCCQSGREPCPNDAEICYDSSTEQCCANGTCDKEQTCCENECCNSIAYCADSGYCSACPPVVETSTTTVDSTTVRLFRVTVTEIEEPEEASEFSCPPMTVTNAQGATLELDEECALSYSPPSTSSTAAMDAHNNAVLRARSQPSCTPFETSTEVITVSQVTTSFSTTTVTITAAEPSFSCPTMAVTNAHGDVLSLGEDCALEYEPGSSSATPAPSGPRAGGGGGGGGGPVTTGGSERSIGRPVGGWWVVVAGLLGVL